MATAVGIDLGTTNSVIAAMEGGQPQVIPNAEATGPRPQWSPSSSPVSGSLDRWPDGKRS